MDSVKLNDIVNRALIQFASIGVTDIYDTLTIDDDKSGFDGFTVVDTILMDSIARLEYLEPFVLRSNIYLRKGVVTTFVDNFDEFLEGKVSREYLCLVPRVIQSIVNTYQGTLTGLHYEAPDLYNDTYTGTYTLNAICNRPVRKQRDGNRYTEESKLYFFGESDAPALLRFKDLFTVNLGKYLVRLDENTQYPSMPIEVMRGLQNYVNELETKNNSDYEISHGYSPIYGFC